jgi:hypothetical protein
VKRPEFDLWPLYRGERFRDRFWQWVKHKLEHVRCYQMLVGPEIAIYYPDSCGGSLHHENWWALVKPDQLDDIAERFASDEVGYHVCKHPVYNAKWFKKNPQVNMRYNPLANDEDISIPCGVCRSYTCCRPKEHGISAIYEQARSN